MLERLESMLAGGGEFLRAETTILLTQLRRSAFWGIVALLSAIAIVLAGGALLVAGGALLAQSVGWIAALALAAGLALLIAGAALMLATSQAKRVFERDAVPVRQRAQSIEAMARITGEAPVNRSSEDNPHHPEHDRSEDPADQWQDKIAEAVTKNPALAASGAFALLALLGPGRSIKMLGRGMMLAGLASSIVKQATESQQQSAPPTPPVTPRPAANAS